MQYANTKYNRRTLKEIRKATVKREELIRSGQISLPRGAGRLAIYVSKNPAHSGPISSLIAYKAFIEEAERLEEERRTIHQAVEINEKSTAEDIENGLADPEVTDMVMIGHGNIRSFLVDGLRRSIDWLHVSKATTHLKSGNFEQRTCGHFPAWEFSVPLGTFAVSELTNVIAAPGELLPDINPDEKLYRPVFTDPHGIQEQLVALNKEHFTLPMTEAAT